MIVKATKYADAREDGYIETYRKYYKDREGLTLYEACNFRSSSDFSDDIKERVSHDNGKTWSEWRGIYEESGFEKHPPHERLFPSDMNMIWNPVHKHYVGIGISRIFINGHEYAYSKLWNSTERTLSDHSHIGVREEGGETRFSLIKYEEGDDFDPADPLKESHFSRNNSMPGQNIVIDENGDILFPIGVSVVKCCQILGIDRNEVFPSKPQRGLIVMRGVWNGKEYEFTPSRPVVISDLQSSRGMDEPTIAKLKSGRILVIFRGAYYMNKAWNTRIEPGTPGFKWYTYSDDGGKTFTPAMPWHFDDGEVIYSSSSYSMLFRGEQNGKLYWIGNITGHKVYENFPRYPLQIVEVDETYGTAKKASYTVIDDRREGEGEKVQLSNFDLMQNRETGHLEVFLTKSGQFPGKPWKAEAWHYEITLE